MRIVNICLCGAYAEGLTYQDNLLPKYHQRLGMETFVIAPTDELSKNGDHERVSEQRYVNKDGVTVIRMDSDQGYRVDDKFRTYSKLNPILTELKPDIIFQHDPQFRGSKIVADYVKSRGGSCRLFVDSHADYSNSATNFLSKHVLHRVIWRHYAKVLEPYTERFWGVLPARVDFLVENYGLPKNKCDLLVMGADDDEVIRASQPEVRTNTRRRFGVSDDDILIVTGGKIDLAKRQTLMLMDAVAKMDQNIKLLVFGPVVPELKNEVESRLKEDRIFHLDWASASESYDYFAASDVVCFPGRHSVYWEQAAGMTRPLIVKRWEGTEHVDVCGNVRFLEEESESAIADAILTVVAQKNEYVKASEKASSEFLYSKIAKRSIAYEF